MERMTREQYMMKKTDIENRMHQTRIDERQAIKAMTLQFEDRLQDEQEKFRKQRNSIMEEREWRSRTSISSVAGSCGLRIVNW